MKRVVITSSVASITYGTNKQGNFNEDDWTDPSNKTTNVYAKSKTLAEKAAWEFIENDSSGMELATILPSMVFGQKPSTGELSQAPFPKNRFQ